MADRQKEEKRKRNGEYAKRFKKKKKTNGKKPEGRPLNVTFAPSAGAFLAVCARCQKEAELPFRPTGSKPVYCDACYTRIRSGAITPEPVTVVTVTSVEVEFEAVAFSAGDKTPSH